MLSELSGRDLNREKVRIRDNFTCQWCGRRWDGQRRLDIHHLDGDKKKSLQYDKESDFNNMITLCHKCHLNLPQSIREMSNGNQHQSVVFLDSEKERFLNDRINEYFLFCILKNKIGFKERLAKYKKPKRGRKPKSLEEKRNEPRTKAMWELRKSGLTLQDISEKFGVTRERVRQILFVYERLK